MGFADHLIHTCTITRSQKTGEDKYGGDEVQEAEVASAVPCRFVEKERRLQSDEHAAGLLIVEHKMLFLPDADLMEGDTISQVTLEDGSVLPNSFTITSVLARRGRKAHHQTAVLERIG